MRHAITFILVPSVGLAFLLIVAAGMMKDNLSARRG
jgi:hypothetical protein